MQQTRVVVTGPFGAAKTQFIRTVSEMDVVSTECKIPLPEPREIKSRDDGYAFWTHDYQGRFCVGAVGDPTSEEAGLHV